MVVVMWAGSACGKGGVVGCLVRVVVVYQSCRGDVA